jgi:catechol 2,3-dioxygenase-like lactoylglutathione lyase family enzyme
VTDVQRSVPFYRDVLGFDFDGFAGDAADPDYAEMLAGRQKTGWTSSPCALRTATTSCSR